MVVEAIPFTFSGYMLAGSPSVSFFLPSALITPSTVAGMPIASRPQFNGGFHAHWIKDKGVHVCATIPSNHCFHTIDWKFSSVHQINLHSRPFVSSGLNAGQYLGQIQIFGYGVFNGNLGFCLQMQAGSSTIMVGSAIFANSRQSVSHLGALTWSSKLCLCHAHSLPCCALFLLCLKLYPIHEPTNCCMLRLPGPLTSSMVPLTTALSLPICIIR